MQCSPPERWSTSARLNSTISSESCRCCGLCSCDLLSKINNSDCIYFLVPPVSKAHKKHSPGPKPRTPFGACDISPVIPLRNKEVWSWRRPSIVLSFRATGIIFTGSQTQDSFGGYDLPAISSLKTTILIFTSFFVCLVFERYEYKPPSWLEARTVFGIEAFVSVISLWKETTLI